MTSGGIEGDARPDQRRAERVHAALVAAARRITADQDPHAQGARSAAGTESPTDFAMFYHQFENAVQGLDADALGCLQEVDDVLDRLTADLADPAEVFCCSLRLVGRLPDTNPWLARAVALGGVSHVGTGPGLADRAARDIDRAMASRRFHLEDSWVALVTAAGGLVSLLAARLQDSTLGADRVDTFAELVLRMMGLSVAQAQELTARRLPAWPVSEYCGDTRTVHRA